MKINLLIICLFLPFCCFAQPSISSNATLDEVLAFIKSDMYITPVNNAMILESEDYIEAFATRKFEYTGCDISYVSSFKHIVVFDKDTIGNYHDIKEYNFSLKDIKYVYCLNNGYIDNIYLKLNRKINVHVIHKTVEPDGFDKMMEEDVIMMHFPMYLTKNIIQAFNRAVELCGGKIENG